MKKEIITTKHPRWEEFVERLTGLEGCDFDEFDGWYCYNNPENPNDKINHVFTRKILSKMFGTNEDGCANIDLDGTIEWLKKHGGNCDCAVIFNVAP
jgi:hypothetical protein